MTDGRLPTPVENGISSPPDNQKRADAYHIECGGSLIRGVDRAYPTVTRDGANP